MEQMSMTASDVLVGRNVEGSRTLSRRRIPGESRFGDLLLSQSLLNLHELNVAIDHAERQQVPLADAIVQLGFLSENDSYGMLAWATGLRPVDLSELTPSTLALRLVPARVARWHVLLPLEADNRILTYAVSQPFDDEAERDVASASGRRPCALLARRSDLVSALDRCYPKLGELDVSLARVRSEASVEMIDGGDTSTHADSPINDLCNHVIARAVEAAASDVHVEPAKRGLTVRYRI